MQPSDLTKDQIAAKVRTIIAYYAELPSADDVGINQVMDDFGFDSLDHVEVAIAVEDKFRISVLDEDMFSDKTTVADIVEYVAKRVGAA